jgi:hypothetical protein
MFSLSVKRKFHIHTNQHVKLLFVYFNI